MNRHLPYSKDKTDTARVVYVREVATEDLSEDLREQLGARSIVYSVNAPDGQRLALVVDRGLAFQLARANDFAPVSVH